jgi:hypothetical protein
MKRESGCPKCGAPSECLHWEEVDIGVGIQEFDHQYGCPWHGVWGFDSEGKALFQDEEDE